MTGLAMVLLFLCIWFLFYARVSSVLGTLISAVLLLVFSFYHAFGPVTLTILWLLFIIAASVMNITPLRIALFSRRFFAHFKQILPPMSRTEREALEAGDVWWEGDLFCGQPNWNKLHAIPTPTLSVEEQAFIDNETEALCRLLDDWKIVQVDVDLSQETWRFLKEKGFFGLVIPKQYGGKGFSAIAHSSIVTKIATRSMSAAVNAMVPNSLGPGELLLHYGTDEQKDYYLPRLAKGEEVPCFALTSSCAGSDAGAMRDTGLVCKGHYQGREVVGIQVTWDKRYITLAPIATVLGLAFKLYDPEHLLGDKEDIGITVALLPTSHPGVQVGERHYPMGIAFMNGPTSGKDVFIPLDFIIGGPKMVGKGWRMLMECLSIGRAISLPGLSTAVAQLGYFSNGIYAHLRQQFKVSLDSFEGIQEKLAEVAGINYIIEASRRMTAGAVDLKVKPAVVSAIQKYHATEMSRRVSDMTMDIHAGRAIQLGPRNYCAQQYISIPIAITVEGANILTRNLIIFGQGAIRCHPYVLAEMEAAADANEARGLRRFDKTLRSHIGYTITNIIRAITMGLTNAHFVKVPNRPELKYYYRQLTRMSNALAVTSDMAMLVLGGALKRKERLSARLGDVLSHLYLATTVLKYYVEQGSQPEDLPYVEWGIQYSLYQIQHAFYEFFANFKPRFLARILRWTVFPFGGHYQRPNDALEAQLVKSMSKPGSIRNRMTQWVYCPKDPQDSLGRLQNAWLKKLATLEIEQRIRDAIRVGTLTRHSDLEAQWQAALLAKVISATDVAQLRDTQVAVEDAMQVDAFAPNFLANRMSR